MTAVMGGTRKRSHVPEASMCPVDDGVYLNGDIYL